MKRRPLSQGVGDHPPELVIGVDRTDRITPEQLQAFEAEVGAVAKAQFEAYVETTGKPSPWLGRSHVARLGRPVLTVCHEHDMHEPCPRCEGANPKGWDEVDGVKLPPIKWGGMR